MKNKQSQLETLNNAPFSNHSFNDFELSISLLQAVKKCAYKKPTKIQAQVIPAILTGKDIVAEAQTGSGKTAAYALPLLEKLVQYRENSKDTEVRSNHIRFLILVPSRELATQVCTEFQRYSLNVIPKINIRTVYGGVPIEPQIKYLKQNTDILVATPRRILALAEKKAVQFNYLQTLVLPQ